MGLGVGWASGSGKHGGREGAGAGRAEGGAERAWDGRGGVEGEGRRAPLQAACRSCPLEKGMTSSWVPWMS